MPKHPTYYHFTPLSLGAWTPQRVFNTAQVEANLYWLKTFSRAAFDADRRRAGEALKAKGGHYSDLAADALAGRDYLLTCMREILFESVREEVAPDLPSRRRCLFLVDGAVDLDAAANRYRFDEQGRTVVAIEPSPGSRVFRARFSLLDTSPIVADIMEAARLYWQGASPGTPHEDVEILFEGAFTVGAVSRIGDGPPMSVEGRGFAEIFAADG
jgi:hypothetical protein